MRKSFVLVVLVQIPRILSVKEGCKEQTSKDISTIGDKENSGIEEWVQRLIFGMGFKQKNGEWSLMNWKKCWASLMSSFSLPLSFQQVNSFFCEGLLHEFFWYELSRFIFIFFSIAII